MKTSDFVKNAFDQAASSYDKHTPMQQWSGQFLLQILKAHTSISSIDKMLDLGCGTGLNTQALYDCFQPRLLNAVDISRKMLDQAQHNCGHKKISFIQSDFDLHCQALQSRYDLIYANMSLQWSNDFVTLLQHYFGKLSNQGLLAFSIPLTGTFSELSEHCQINNFYTENTVLKILQSTGYRTTRYIESYCIEYLSESERLKAIKNAGVHYVKNRTSKHSVSKLRKRLRMSSESSYPLTYNVGFFIGAKQ